MKHKKIIQIVGIVICSITILCLLVGMFYGLFKRDNKTSLSAYADEFYQNETITNNFEIYAPADCFPITFYGFNGTSKKTTVINENGGILPITTTFSKDTEDTTGEFVRVVTEGTITYMLAVDKNGNILTVDFNSSYENITFPLTATLVNGSYFELYLNLYHYNNEIGNYYSHAYDNGYNDGYDYGYDIGQGNGYDNGYNEGYDIGYEDGSDEGAQRGYDYGYSVGHLEGYDEGYDIGYEDGYTNGENLTQSQVITNPISAFLQPVHEFMNTKFFGDLTYASIFNVVLFVCVALIFLKMFSGG